jgi:hypothetical protein
MRQRVRKLNRRGEAVSLRRVRSGLAQEEEQEALPLNTHWRTIPRRGCVYGPSKRRSALTARESVIIASRQYLRQTRGHRARSGGTSRAAVSRDETALNVNPANDNPGYVEADGPGGNQPAGQGPRLIIVPAITPAGWVRGAQRGFQAKHRPGD